ncbi:MAG: hypothetical protein OEZ41_08620 [Nitrospirota bacterium]|nr:hypothetical protein [Nitrospirota bacterium]
MKKTEPSVSETPAECSAFWGTEHVLRSVVILSDTKALAESWACSIWAQILRPGLRMTKRLRASQGFPGGHLRLTWVLIDDRLKS